MVIGNNSKYYYAVCIYHPKALLLIVLLSISPLILLGVSIGAIVSLVTLICKRHDSPVNLYLLAIFVSNICFNEYHFESFFVYFQTFFESVSLGTIITFYDSSVVIKAFVITTAVFIVLTAYAMQSKYDYSTWGAG